MSHNWCNAAHLRRSQIESGADITFNKVFKPLFIDLVTKLSPKDVLEVGAGTGHLSKELDYRGFSVTSIEPSNGMYEVAKEVLKTTNVTLINQEVAKIDSSLVFDVVVSNMVAHVVDDITLFIRSIYSCLAGNGHFIFSIPHPCFYNDYKNILGDDYNYMRSQLKTISFAITKDPSNEITGVPYHHHPLSEYIASLVRSGFVIDGFEEIYPDNDVQKLYGNPWDTPRYCFFVCKKVI